VVRACSENIAGRTVADLRNRVAKVEQQFRGTAPRTAADVYVTTDQRAGSVITRQVAHHHTEMTLRNLLGDTTIGLLCLPPATTIQSYCT
jgi:hypothetical protein